MKKATQNLVTSPPRQSEDENLCHGLLKQAVKKVHENLGHPRKLAMLRALRIGKRFSGSLECSGFSHM